jgi:hypothetical protein
MSLVGNRGGGAGALAVNNNHIFATTTARNTYFASNPSEVVQDMYISVSGVLQKRVNTAWVDTSALIRGANGANGVNAPSLLINYSADGASGWTSTLDTAIHKYWRWSTDNGVTWNPAAPDVALFKAEEGVSSLPAPFSFSTSGGMLEILKGTSTVLTVDENELRGLGGISTGDGELNLGEMHYIGSAGDMVTIKNNSANMFMHPAYGAISLDGLTIVEQMARVHTAGIQVMLPAGGVGVGQVNYNSTFTPAVNSCFLKVRLIPDETYTGDLTLTVRNVTSGLKVSQFTFNTSIFTGTPIDVPFKHPLWLRAGQEYSTAIEKPNGNYLLVKSNSAGDQPYRESSFLEFNDYPLFHAGNAAAQVTALTALTGASRLPATAVRDFPVMSGTELGMAKLGSTLSINGTGELNVAVAPTSIPIVANEAARLAIPQSTGVILAIQQDTGVTWGIEANNDPSVALNWKQIGTVATNVVSFNGRIGAVSPTTNDYNMEQIGLTDRISAAKYVFRVDNGVPYLEEIA